MKRPELRSSPTCETQSCTFHDHIIVIDFQIYLFLSFKNFIHCPLVNMHQQFFKLKVMIAAEVRGERREVQEKREKLSLLRGKVPPRLQRSKHYSLADFGDPHSPCCIIEFHLAIDVLWTILSQEASAAIARGSVFGKLKFESGIHRVQRIPVTEKSRQIHTSVVSIAILPHADEVINNHTL
ncbi:Peptide chain release factor 1 [Glycine soja]